MSTRVHAGAAAGACLHVRTLILSEDAETSSQLPGPWLVAQRTVVTTEPVMRKLTGLESAASVDAAGGCQASQWVWRQCELAPR